MPTGRFLSSSRWTRAFILAEVSIGLGQWKGMYAPPTTTWTAMATIGASWEMSKLLSTWQDVTQPIQYSKWYTVSITQR